MMTRLWSVCIPLAIVLVSFASETAAQTDREVVLFSGELTTVQPAAWGTGNAMLSEEEEYLERDVLEIDTKGFYEGGRLTLKQPLAMAPFLTAPEKSFLVLIVRVHQAAPETQMPMGPDEMMFGPDDMPMGHPGDFPPDAEPPPPAPGEWDPAMGPPPHEEMLPGMEDMPGMMGGPQAPPPPMVTKLRALLVTDKGQIDSGAVEILDTEDALENWYTMVIPLASFSGGGMDREARLEHLALFGNAEEKFWVATAKLVAESQPLVADAGQHKTVKANTDVEFEAVPQPGGISAHYVWDFDDWDGIGDDVHGQKVAWSFAEPGFYVVTLTVSDRSGRKLPQMARVHVKVEE
jgi:hypothetical protein